MEIKTLKTVWIAEDHDYGEIICVTNKFEDMIDILIDAEYINEKTEIKTADSWKYISEVFGEKWKDIFKKFSSKKIDRIMDWEVSLHQVDLVEVVR